MSDIKRVLLTGGTGYIGSHVVVELLQAGYLPVVVDNGHNSKAELCVRNVLSVVGGKDGQIASRFPPNTDLVELHQVDLLDTQAVDKLFEQYGEAGLAGVIHLAAWKAVGESGEKPLEYYQNNVVSTLNLLQAMRKWRIRNFVYSSSATVYGEPDKTPIPETAAFRMESPYSRTKVFCEYILMDMAKADPELNVCTLRYFNPAGAHPSGKIGEDPQGRPNNLLPLLSAIACGRIQGPLKVFGNDFPTPDGTPLRDYLHVCDLALGHVKALDAILSGHIYKKSDENKQQQQGHYRAFNLGTGRAFSVLQMIEAMRKATGKELPYDIVGRRQGDVPDLTADPTLANEELGWKAEKDLETMCADLWRWQSSHPQGFEEGEKL